MWKNCLKNLILSPSLLVCGPSDLSAGPFFHLVWKPVWMERQQDSLEALSLRRDLSYHAFSLPRLLDSPKVKG